MYSYLEVKLPKWSLIILLLLSAAIHILYVAVSDVTLSGDAFLYNFTATSFAERGKLIGTEYGYSRESDAIVLKEVPYTLGGIGYPLYLGVVYKLFGAEGGKKVATIIQALLVGVLIPILGYLITQKIAVATALSLWPSGFILIEKLNTEALSSVLIFLVVYLAWRLPNLKRVVALSVFASGLFLIRYEFFPLSALFTFFILRSGLNKKNLLATAILVGTLLIPSIYNYMSLNKFIPLSTSGGRTLWLAATCQGNFNFEENKREFSKIYVDGDSQATDKNYRLAAKEIISADPLRYVSCVGMRIGKVLFTGYGEPSLSTATITEKIWKVFLRLLKLVMVFGFLFAVYFQIKEKKLIGYLLLGIFVYKFIFLHGILYGEPRFFTIMEPVCLLMLSFLPIGRQKSF